MTLALSCKILVIAAGIEMFAAVCFFYVNIGQSRVIKVNREHKKQR